MPISRGQMQRELYGVGSLVGREKFGLGSSLKKFVRKIIPNEVAEVAVKAAPFVAPFNPLLAGGMSALGSFDQTGSIGQSVKSGLINYGLGQGARYLGGAQMQTGINPFAGDKLLTSPIGLERTGLGTFLQDKGYYTPGIEQVPVSPEKIPGPIEGVVKTSVQKTSPFQESVQKVLSGDFTVMGEGLKELGGQGLKKVFTNPVRDASGKIIDYEIDKLAIGSAIAGGANYLEARKLAKEAELVEDEEEYTEEMYEADKARYKDYYSQILTPEAFGLKDGGRVKYAEGSLSKNRIAQLMSLLESETIDEDYKKQIKQEIDQLMGKYKSGGRVNLKGGGKSDYWETVTRMFIEAGGEKGTGMNINDFADKYFPKMQDGGRVKLELGSTPGGIPSIKLKEKDDEFMTFEELKEKYPGMAMDTTTFNPIPEDADRQAAAEIAKVIMGTRGMPEEGESDVMSSSEFIFDSYVIPKRKELMEDFGLSLKEADDLIREEMAKYKIKKANGGRIGYKIGSKPSEDELGIMSLDIEKDGDEDEKMLMADAPGITFTRQEKSYLFRTLAGQGGSDRSFTMPQLYGILNNPNSDKNIDDAKALKAFLKMKGFKTGGRVKLKDGYSPEIIKKAREKWNSVYGKDKWGEEILVKDLYSGGFDEFLDIFTGEAYEKKAYGGRIGYMMGSEVPVRKNQGGITELDYRNTGGFVPIGVKEKADDVPAMLSKNEFVFTADAVRAAGGGSVNKGAQRMYNLMKSLENKVV